MTPDELREICVAIWGEHGWRPRAAAFLDVQGRTVNRWADGTAPIPPNIRAELLAKAQEVADALDALLEAAEDESERLLSGSGE